MDVQADGQRSDEPAPHGATLPSVPATSAAAGPGRARSTGGRPMLVTTTDLIVIGTITVVVLVLGLLVWLLGRNR